MSDVFPPTKQRPALIELVKALGARDNALRRDECGDWAIFGKFGHIYAVPGSLDRPKSPGFQITVQCESVREWSYARKALKPFAAVTNDGDADGMLFLERLPTAHEAEIIRSHVGLAKKRMMSEEERVRLASIGHRFEKRSDVGGDDQRELSALDATPVGWPATYAPAPFLMAYAPSPVWTPR